MSETTGPAPPAAPTTESDGTSYAPPPDTRPDLSVSDAARLLRNQRRAQAQQAAQQAQPPGDRPVGYGHNSGEPPPAPAPVEAKPSGVAALEAALGLGGDSVSRETSDSPAVPSQAAGMPAEIEIEGQRFSHQALRDAVLMSRDYTQKTQALAEQARQLQAQQQALAAALPLIQPEIEALQRRLMDAPRPDPTLRNTDPAAYWDQLATWQDAQIEQQRIAQLNAMQAQARDAAMAQAVAQANAQLAQKYPFWSDPQQRREVQSSIIEYARREGYSDQELQSLTNPRYLETLFKASLYDKYAQGLRTRAPTPSVQPAPQRGAAPPPPPAARVSQAAEAFDQRPNVANAAALIAARRAGRPNGHTQW